MSLLQPAHFEVCNSKDMLRPQTAWTYKTECTAVQPMLCQYNSKYVAQLITVDSTQSRLHFCMHKTIGYKCTRDQDPKACITLKQSAEFGVSYHNSADTSNREDACC